MNPDRAPKPGSVTKVQGIDSGLSYGRPPGARARVYRSKLILSVTEDFRHKDHHRPAPPCQAIPRPAHDHERAPTEPERTLTTPPIRARTPPLTSPNRLNVRSGSDVGPPPVLAACLRAIQPA